MPRERVGPKALQEEVARVRELLSRGETPYIHIRDGINLLGISEGGARLSKSDKFTTIALVCGPPTVGFRWDWQKSTDFRTLAGELFGLEQDRDVRGLYELYEEWYASEDGDHP